MHDPPHTLSNLDLELAIAWVHASINKIEDRGQDAPDGLYSRLKRLRREKQRRARR